MLHRNPWLPQTYTYKENYFAFHPQQKTRKMRVNPTKNLIKRSPALPTLPFGGGFIQPGGI